MRHRSKMALMGILVILLTGCGSGAKPTPTTPQNTPSPFPTYEYVAPTSVIAATAAATAAATTVSTQALDPERVALGKGRYEALDCGSCHGADAKGTSKGKTLVPNKLTEAQFIDFLRSGGKLGNEHLFSTNRLSETGGKNLYLYIASLSSGN